jgi:hypothetical protein
LRTKLIWLGYYILSALIGYCLGLALMHASSGRDIVFANAAPACKGGAVECSRVLWFNGNWDGTMLCKGHTCVAFEEVFREERH